MFSQSAISKALSLSPKSFHGPVKNIAGGALLSLFVAQQVFAASGPADLDGDRIPNAVEVLVGLDPSNPDDAGEDFDDDGFSNQQEYQSGTDMLDVRNNSLILNNPHEKVFANNGEAIDSFGSAVSIDGDLAVISAIQAGSAGGVYVFQYIAGQWLLVQELTPSDLLDGENFGSSVVVRGTEIFVGARFDGANGNHSGSVYIFELGEGGQWIESQKILAFDGDTDDEFGLSLAVTGDFLMVGAPNNDQSADNAGSVYVFKKDGLWFEMEKIQATDSLDGARFGHSVAASGDLMVIGAPQHSTSGAAYVFRNEGGSWIQDQKMISEEVASNGQFGSSVAVEDDVAVIGAVLDDPKGQASGSAYVFVRNGVAWEQQQVLSASRGRKFDEFGFSVALSDERIVVGATADKDVYLYGSSPNLVEELPLKHSTQRCFLPWTRSLSMTRSLDFLPLGKLRRLI